MRFLTTACLTAALILCAFSLAFAAGVRGTVFGPDQRPMGDAQLVLTGAAGEPQRAATDAAGRYRFEGLAPGRYSLVARKAGFADQRQPVTLTNAGQVLGVSFRLQPWSAIPWSITGTVVSGDGGRPLAGAKVALTLEAMPGRRDEAANTTTDDVGFYAFTGLKPGRYSLSVTAARHLPANRADILLRGELDRPRADFALSTPPKETLPGEVPIEAVGPEGRPLAQTEIRIHLDGECANTSAPWGEDMPAREWQEQTYAGDGRSRMKLRVTHTTDADGRVLFTLPPGTWKIDLRAKGILSPVQTVVVPPDGRAETAPFRMAAGEEPAEPPRPEPAPAPRGSLRGVAQKPDGTPLADCGIYLFVAAERAGGNAWDNERGSLTEAYTTTNAVGVFERAALPAGPVLVAVKTRGFAESDPVRAQVPAEGVAEVVLRLPGPSLQASGRVADSDGKPMAGVRVYAYRLLGRWQDSRFWDGIRNLWLGGRQQDGGPWPFDTPVEGLKAGVIPGLLQHGISYAETNAEGRFVLPELDPGSYHFGAAAGGYARAAREKVTLAAGAPLPELALSLPLLGGFEGAVVRAGGGPIGRVDARCTGMRQGDEQQRWEDLHARMDPDGHYRVDDIEPGTYRLRVRVPGYQAADRDQVVVQAGKRTPGVDIRLEEGLVLRGRVTRPDGTPAAGASVTYYQHQQGGPYQPVTAMTGADGAFTLTGLSPGSGTCGARLSPFAPARSDVALPQAAGAALEVRLTVGATIRGTLRDEEGKPIPDAYVQWYRVPPVRYGDAHESPRTTAGGEFILTGLPAVRITVNATKEGYRYVVETRELAEGAQVTLDLKMARLRYGKLRGRLLKPDGTPAPGVVVRAWTEGASQVTATTDAQGAFRFEQIAAGLAHLMPEGRPMPGQKLQLEVKPGEETVAPDIRLTEAGNIECTIRGLEQPAGRTPVMLLALAEAQAPDGKTIAPAEGVRLYIRGGGEVRARPVTAPTPAGVTGVLSYSPGGMVHLLYPAGTRPGFDLFGPPGPPTAQVTGGVTTLRQVPVGRCRVCLALPRERDGLAVLPGVPVTVAAGQTVRAEISVVPGGKLTGRLTPALATPDMIMPQIWCFRRQTLDLAGMAMPRPDGSFALDGMAPGDYVICLWLSGHAGNWQPFTIRAGESTDLALAPAKGVALRGRVDGVRTKSMLVCAESETSFDAGQVAEDGSFVIEHLLPGTFTVRLWADGGEKVVTLPGVAVGGNGTEGVVLKWE